MKNEILRWNFELNYLNWYILIVSKNIKLIKYNFAFLVDY